MTTATYVPSRNIAEPQDTRFASIAQSLPRYGLALVVAWVGMMKFTAYEAEAISGLVSNSPLMSWMYSVLSTQGVSNLIGIAEVAIAGLLVVGGRFPKALLAGSAGAVAMFGTTLTFMVSTPGVFEASLGGFPAVSVMPGQFLLKDVAFLAVAVSLLGRAVERIRQPA